jgi:hypothetical protein
VETLGSDVKEASTEAQALHDPAIGLRTTNEIQGQRDQGTGTGRGRAYCYPKQDKGHILNQCTIGYISYQA